MMELSQKAQELQGVSESKSTGVRQEQAMSAEISTHLRRCAAPMPLAWPQGKVRTTQWVEVPAGKKDLQEKASWHKFFISIGS